MSEKTIQPVRGTHDLLGEDYRKHQWIRDVAYGVAAKYGYEPIAIPMFEHTAVFKRSIGETTDIVGKEMYTFEDRGGDSITLRPEATAGMMRAVISNGLTQSMPLKLITDGPMMRYERPQKGRTRQFHQIDVECLGVSDPLVDVEIIAMGAQVLDELGLLGRSVLEINTIGDISSRAAYRKALVDFFTPLSSQLSPDSQMRLSKNPLRILDSKDPTDRELITNAPVFDDYLNDLSKDNFKRVCEGLDTIGVPYKHNVHLVRGLDYYCHTAFEFVTTDLGSQGALLAGGRYDGLIAQLGGPETPGIGWAMGIDRIALMLDVAPPQPRPIAVVAVGDDTLDQAFQLAMSLRRNGIMVEFAYSGNVGKRLKRADKANACAAVLIGADEMTAQKATVRNLDTGDQNLVAFTDLKDYLVTTFKQQ